MRTSPVSVSTSTSTNEALARSPRNISVCRLRSARQAITSPGILAATCLKGSAREGCALTNSLPSAASSSSGFAFSSGAAMPRSF
jgi:hypothetical protein